jgi:hypothetical protein
MLAYSSSRNRKEAPNDVHLLWSERSFFLHILCASSGKRENPRVHGKSDWFPAPFIPQKNRIPDRLNWHRIDELYKLETSVADSMAAIELCHRLILSYVFIEVAGPRKTIAGVFFASGHSKRRGLWSIRFSDVLELLRETGRDYPSAAEMVRHPKTDEWLVWAGHGRPPHEWEKWRRQ